MTETAKTLAQLTPSANTLTTLYTVPASTSTVVSTLIVCNQNGSQILFRVSVAVAGAADTTKQYLYFDLPLVGNDTFAATLGITLATTDVIRFQTNSSGVSVNLFGVEVS